MFADATNAADSFGNVVRIYRLLNLNGIRSNIPGIVDELRLIMSSFFGVFTQNNFRAYIMLYCVFIIIDWFFFKYSLV